MTAFMVTLLIPSAVGVLLGWYVLGTWLVHRVESNQQRRYPCRDFNTDLTGRPR